MDDNSSFCSLPQLFELGPLVQKKSKISVDNQGLVRYNGGSLSKSAFPTSTKRNRKRGNLLRSLCWLQIFLKTL